MSITRRALSLGLPAASLLGAASIPGQGAATQPRAAARTPIVPLAQVAIGRFTITALVDGHADMPFNYFPGQDAAAVEAAARAQFLARPTGIRFVFNQYLVDDGERLVLIDTGPAGLMGETGRLPSALEALGVRADQIGAVIITHAHVDHTGGLVAGGVRRFPNSDVYLHRRDIAYWTDPARRAAAQDFLKPSFDATRDIVRLYPRLQGIDGERQISPGISTVDLTGHTPGHIGVRIEDGGQSLLMVSDMLFPSVHPANSGVGFLFEQDPVAARQMRARFFPRAAEEGALIAATHMPFPGLGRIVSDGGAARWLPAEWAQSS
jgi:glyoxylase-like metal-dependent hydrolase (beta-lactamase superfamily II)